MSKITNDRLNPVWHRMLYGRTHLATVAVKALSQWSFRYNSISFLLNGGGST